MKTARSIGRVLALGTATCGLAVGALSRKAGAQTPIGSVATVDAIVAGNTATDNQRSMLRGNVTVTAKDHPAYVELLRGGSVKVCSTSAIHLTAGNPIAPAVIEQVNGPAEAEGKKALALDASAPAGPSQIPLMVSLDRGAAELHASVLASDVLMTPDLRVSFSVAGPLDLRVRVANNGDTCVENRVAGMGQHPALEIGSLFGNDNYRVLPGQHVMFEHGSLREVVDNESSPCGCPDQAVKTMEASQSSFLLPGTKVPPPPQIATQYPFPADVSQGLAPPPLPPQSDPGVTHTQVATTMVYNGDRPASQPVTSPPSQVKVERPQKTGFFHGIAQFFKKAFGG